MKYFGKAVVMGVALMGSSVAMAECPVELPIDNLLDCIAEEGAGGEYPTAQVLKEMNDSQSDGKQTYINDGRSADDVDDA
jgi:hypothetical protein